jgi:hypothetical protein
MRRRQPTYEQLDSREVSEPSQISLQRVESKSLNANSMMNSYAHSSFCVCPHYVCAGFGGKKTPAGLTHRVQKTMFCC